MRTYFYTRFGIGVADPLWWAYRMRLFEAVTFPSLGVHLGTQNHWVIATDAAMDSHYSKQLYELIDSSGKAPFITVVPVTAYAQAPIAFGALLAHFEEVRVVRIDDDDAVSREFLDFLPTKPGIYTIPLGYEADLAQRRIRTIRRPFLSMNTIFQGPGSMVQEYVSVGHHRIKDWGVTRRITATEVDSPNQSYIYSRHKQSDSTFAAIRRSILDDKQSKVFTSAARSRFGINEPAFNEWRRFAQTAPSTNNRKTWNINSELNSQSALLVKRLSALNKMIRANTENIFGE